jgi:hypothetical protein
VPYEKAFEMGEAERMAHAVVFGEQEGNRWSWQGMRWLNDK